MTTQLNIVSLSGAAAASSSPAAGQSTTDGTDATTGAAAQGFQDLLAMLLDLLAASGTDASATDASSAIQSSTTTDQSSNAAVSLCGLIDLKSILDLKALLAAKAADDTDATDKSTETPDPLAAVLDVLIAALQNAGSAKPEGDQLTLDSKSADTLKALNDLLALLNAGKTSGKDASPLPSEIVDKLKTLDQLLANQSSDPRLADLKSRISDLLGTGTSNDPIKAASKDPTVASIATLLGQNGTDKQASGTQRDVMAHVLDGAKTALPASPANANADGGDTADQDASQSQAPQSPATDRQAAATAGFAAQVAADAKDAVASADSPSDPVTTLAAQSVDRLQQATQARAIPAAYSQSTNRIDIPQVAFEIARHAVDGVSRFQIRLDPPDMGRIDVRLDIDHSGALTARLTVDRPETYDMLQRDARGLERALAQTGLDSGKTNLEFSLRQNPFARQDSGQGQRQDTQSWLPETEETSTPPVATPPVTLYRGSIRPGGVNLVA